MAKCLQCPNEAEPGSNLCKQHLLDGKSVLQYVQPVETDNTEE